MTEPSKWGLYRAVRIGPDHRPSGDVLAEAPATGQGVPAEVRAQWVAGKVAIVWSANLPPPRQLPEASLASVRQKRLHRRLTKDVPLLVDVLEPKEIARRPAFYAGKLEP